jgi:hypothetical protein
VVASLSEKARLLDKKWGEVLRIAWNWRSPSPALKARLASPPRNLPNDRLKLTGSWSSSSWASESK